jgi:CRP-like cAMP-binding protein
LRLAVPAQLAPLGAPRRRIAVHASRDSAAAGAVASKYGAGVPCSERRLPTEGGPVVPKAAADVRVVAKAAEGIALFAGIPKEDRAALFASMYTFDYAANEFIMKQGEEGRNFYIVVQGAPVVSVTGADGSLELSKALGPGDTFGEMALLHGGVRSASVRAGDAPVKTWVLGRATFRQVLSDAAFARRKKYGELLASVKPLSSLTDYARSQLADAVVPLAYARGDVIIAQGSLEGARFHIIDRGAVTVVVGGTAVATLGPGNYFGEVCILGGAVPTATVTAAEDGVRTIALDRAGFRRMLGDEVQDALAAHMKTYVFEPGSSPAAPAPAGLLGANAPASSHSAAKRPPTAGVAQLTAEMAAAKMLADAATPALAPKLARRDLVALKELGVGMTGNVYLCRVPVASGNGTALVVAKIMSKVKMLRMNQVWNVLKEKSILEQFTCPHIVHSLSSFQDKGSLYLLLEFMAGGDLFQHLCDVRRLAFGPARFYAAEVLLALEYIHTASHVYRDLKPENILMDATGHVKLADMGFCKELRAGERTYTTCGTADYMAPEVMLCQGYNRSADYWAFGVLVFEMLTGNAPFASKSDRERHHKILNATLAFPPDFNLQAKDLVSRLCVLDISHRLGMMAGGLEEIQDHAFFSDVDWYAMRTLAVKPPFVPRVRSQAERDARASMKLPEAKEEALHPEDEAMFAGY